MGLQEDFDQIGVQERELKLPRFDAQVAWELGMNLRKMAVERNVAMVIDIRRFGQPLFYSALEGTSPDNAEWVRRKGNVVARFHRSSLGLKLRMEIRKSTIYERQGLPLADYASDGGSFPITVEGAGVIGSATVSGLSGREDHELVVEALCALLARNYAELRLPAE